MARCFLTQCVAWATLAAYLVVALGGVAVVLCEGVDGHRGIELAHGQGTCGAAHDEQGAAEPALKHAHPHGCHDTPLDALTSDDPAPPRWQAAQVTLLPPPLLPQVAWDLPDRKLHCEAVPADPPPPPFHLDTIRSVVLVI